MLDVDDNREYLEYLERERILRAAMERLVRAGGRKSTAYGA